MHILHNRYARAAVLTFSAVLAGGPKALAITPSVRAATQPGPRRNAARAPESTAKGTPLTQEEEAAQVLSRFSFGPGPGELNLIKRAGWERWFEQQLNPGAIPDSALEKRLAQYPALQLTPQQLAIQYPDGQVIRRIAEGRASTPADPELAGVYQVLLARYERKQAEDKAEAAATQVAPAGMPPAASSAAASGQAPAEAAAQMDTRKQQKRDSKQQDQAEARALLPQILATPKDQRMQAILRLPVEQRLALAGGLIGPEKNLLTADMNPHEKELFAMMAGGYAGSGVIGSELQQAKILRAVLSERQLLEVMTDFWLNHFNIDLGKSGDMLNYAASYERDAIRAHALGKFRDLLLATAEHPAMLIYLDNFQSIGPDSQAAGRARSMSKNPQQRGLNENYGREVMELHTLGVDGGYTQADVTNLAKILTGWTIDQPQMGGSFVFDPRKHEPGTKLWLGQKIDGQAGPAGFNEGVQALSRLAASPQTAHHLSLELAQRFVADAPAPALVDRMAAAYLASDGDISTLLRTMVHSPEFFSRVNYRTKVKMPLEYIASSLRATNTDPANPGALANELKAMGEPLYRCLPPTGYAATADHWMNSAALVDRLNYALQLTGGQFGGMRFDAPRLLAAGLLSRPGPAPGVSTHVVALRGHDDPQSVSGEEEAMALMENLLVPGPVSAKTNAVIRSQLDAVTPDIPAPTATLPDASDSLNKLAAMILGSPEFQVH